MAMMPLGQASTHFAQPLHAARSLNATPGGQMRGLFFCPPRSKSRRLRETSIIISPSMSGRPRRAVNDLEHPDDKAIGSNKSDRQNGPDSEGQNGEGHKLPRPTWLFICVLRRDYFRHIRVSYSFRVIIPQKTEIFNHLILLIIYQN